MLKTLMKPFFFTRRVILFFFIAAQICACTNTPWHQEQAENFLKKGISFISIEQYNSALKELLEAEKYSPDNHEVHYYMGIAYHGKGLKEKAVEEMKKAVSSKEDYSEAHNHLGTLYADKGLWDQAIEEYDRALVNPIYDTPEMALYNAGWAYYSKKDYEKSLIKYQEALRRAPLSILRPQIEKCIGLLFFDQNNYLEAAQHLQKSVELNNSLYDVHFLLGECYLKIRDAEKAKKAFQTVMKLAPQSSLGRQAQNYLHSMK